MDNISYDDFCKADIRSGTVLKSEKVSKSDKLLRLEVNFGPEIGVRVIVAGIAKHFDADSMLNHQVIAVVNMAPRKIMGIESHGMILAGHVPPHITTPDVDRLSLVQCNFLPDGEKIG